MDTCDFMCFWDRYGKKRERGDAERAWQRLTDGERQAAVKGIDGFRRHAGRQGAAIPYPAAYLNQRLWKKTGRGRRPKAAAPAASRSVHTDPFDEMEMW